MAHNRIVTKIIAVFCLMFLLLSPLTVAIAAAAERNESMVELTADRIVYDDMSGKALAEGKAVLSYKDIRISAERIDYDDEGGTVIASSPADVGVALSNGKQSVRGDTLKYDLNSAEGVLTGAHTTLMFDGKPLYVRGENLEAIPYELAVERKLIGGKDGGEGEYVVKWDDVSLTTCTLEHSHYRLEAKRFVFIPGKKIVVKNARLYLGNRYMFTYPFDYIINVKRTKAIRSTILPNIAFGDSKGVGVGISAPITWNSGGISLGLLYWSKIGLEWNVEFEQSLGRDVSLFASVEYTWDKLWDEKKYRPDISLRFDKANWFTQLSWRKNEYLEIQKNADYQYRGELDTIPELLISSQWLGRGSPAWYRVGAMWGSYRASTLLDTEPWRGRLKVSAETYGEVLGSAMTPFWNIKASAMFYDTDSLRQDIISAAFGFKYALGGLEMGTAYQRSWVSGETSMSWDKEFESEKIYQMLNLPLGKYLSFGVLGGYDLQASLLEQMNYILRYTNDCMIWEITYRNNRNYDGENKVFFGVGLRGTPLWFKNEEASNPFLPPDDLPKK